MDKDWPTSRLGRTVPVDLGLILLLVAAANVAILSPVVGDSPFRIPFGLALVLLGPGYAFLAVLFPEAGGPSGRSARDEMTTPTESPHPAGRSDCVSRLMRDPAGLKAVERIALSIGLSIAIVLLLGLGLNFSPWGIQLVPILLAESVFTVVMTVIATVRRWQLPPDERFRIPFETWSTKSPAALFSPDTRTDTVLNLCIVATVLLAAGSIGFTMSSPSEEGRFSAIYILNESTDGDPVTAEYPSELEPGDSVEPVLGIDNHEYRTVEYTVVVVEQRVDPTGNKPSIEDQHELDRFEITLTHNESRRSTHEITPTMTGENVRIVWLLYADDVPEEPSTATTEYMVQLNLDIDSPEQKQ